MVGWTTNLNCCRISEPSTVLGRCVFGLFTNIFLREHVEINWIYTQILGCNREHPENFFFKQGIPTTKPLFATGILRGGVRSKWSIWKSHCIFFCFIDIFSFWEMKQKYLASKLFLAWNTLPKTNRSHLQIGKSPKGKDRLPSNFQGQHTNTFW